MTPDSATTIHLLATMLALGDDPCDLPRVERSRIADSLLTLAMELTPEIRELIPDDAVPPTLRTGQNSPANRGRAPRSTT